MADVLGGVVVAVDVALLEGSVCAVLWVGLGCVLEGCLELTTVGKEGKA